MSVLETGISGLLAAQRSLSVVSHNIANVNTEGYSRQRTELGARSPTLFGYGYVGNGVTVNSIQRVYDQFAIDQVRTTTSAYGQAQQFLALSDQINNLLAASGGGVMPALQNFFDAVQGVANEPSSQVARQIMIGEANALAAQFRYVDQQLDSLRDNANALLATSVDQVNNLTSGIADINRRVAEAGPGGAPNDLLDRRDELVRQLADLVSVSTASQDDGSLNVFIGSGQAVVIGGQSRSLSAVQNPHDPQRLEVAFASATSSPVVITGQLSGGAIGGILEFRGQILDPARSAINQLAYGVAATFNELHATGMDLRGELGGAFFTPPDAAGPPPTTLVLPHARNAGSPPAVIGATVTDVGALTTSDYRLERSGSGYTLTRLGDNAVFALPGFPGAPVTVDGVTITLQDGAIADGDSFVISPAYNAARNFGVAISDPALIAAAGPLRASASLGNLGTGTVGAPELMDRDAWTGESWRILAVDTDADGVADGYSVLDGNDAVVAAGPWSAGAVEFAGVRVTLGGVPRPGDEFTVMPNAGGVSDNRNALALAGLQTGRTMNNGSASYQSLYGALVGDVGNKTQQAQVNATVQASLLGRAVEAREAVSGVNLDEEAAAILRLQQAYQAAAQLISTANTMFETLIAMVRR